jgi:hypothetical protein
MVKIIVWSSVTSGLSGFTDWRKLIIVVKRIVTVYGIRFPVPVNYLL